LKAQTIKNYLISTFKKMSGPNPSGLGFTGVPKRFQPRDSHFTGASNNPSKKGAIMFVTKNQNTPDKQSLAAESVRQAQSFEGSPAVVATPTSAGLLERKCEFMETQVKRHTAQIQELLDSNHRLLAQSSSASHVMQANQELLDSNHRLLAQSSSASHVMQAKVARQTIEFDAPPATTNDAESGGAESGDAITVAKDQLLKVMYPMETHKTINGHAIFMRHLEIDSNTAQLRSSWIKVYEKQDGQDIYYLTDFTL
jgi:hypothetical protein